MIWYYVLRYVLRKDGKMERWKDGIMERWNNGKME